MQYSDMISVQKSHGEQNRDIYFAGLTVENIHKGGTIQWMAYFKERYQNETFDTALILYHIYKKILCHIGVLRPIQI